MQAIVQDRYGAAEVLESRDIDRPRSATGKSWSVSMPRRSMSVT